MIASEILEGQFNSDKLICPMCNNAILIAERDSIYNLEERLISDPIFALQFGMHQTSHSLKLYNLKCVNISCNGRIIVIVDEFGELNTENNPPFIFKVDGYNYTRKTKFMYPSVDLIKIPDRMPVTLAQILRISFILYWIDFDSCANKLRVFLESFLDLKKIPKQVKISKGNKIKRLQLNDRIKILRKHTKFSGIADRIEAVKWVGNEGSHRGSVSRELLIHAFELIESLIIETYYKDSNSISKLAKKIISRKGK